jgi:CRP-like cAMP-binding protein
MRPPVPTLRNHMLSQLAQSDRDLLAPHLEPVEFGVRHGIDDINKPIKHVYFPESGIVSVVAISAPDRQIEAGIIGREGMTGLVLATGGERSPYSTFVQVGGHGTRIQAGHLRSAMATSPSLQRALLRFVAGFMVQVAHTALANGRATVDQRLARWLLMAHDRMDGDQFALTHELLALMLGVRRAGVTTALRQLEGRRLIAKKRGLISIADRAGLENYATGLYGYPEAELLRLTGWKPGRAPR